jgi:F-type H+-transporting ATPase subunit b
MAATQRLARVGRRLFLPIAVWSLAAALATTARADQPQPAEDPAEAAGFASHHSETTGEGHAGAHHELEAPPPINWTNWSSFKTKNAEGEPLGTQDEPMAPPLLFALFNFAVFASLLVWKAGPPIRKWLVERHTSVKDALEEAAKLREQARAKLASYDDQIANVNSEVERLISEIRADAEAEKLRILKDAETQAAALELAAKQRIEAEAARVRSVLRKEVTAAAVEVAERMLREKTTQQDQRTLVSGFIADLAANTPTSPSPGGAADEGTR